jgi:hypothetical protein
MLSPTSVVAAVPDALHEHNCLLLASPAAACHTQDEQPSLAGRGALRRQQRKAAPTVASRTEAVQTDRIVRRRVLESTAAPMHSGECQIGRYPTKRVTPRGLKPSVTCDLLVTFRS